MSTLTKSLTGKLLCLVWNFVAWNRVLLSVLFRLLCGYGDGLLPCILCVLTTCCLCTQTGSCNNEM